METTQIKTRSGLSFTADVAGPAGGVLVLLLHGFPESRHSWRAAMPELAKAGYHAVAPDQRGYSAHARPDPATLDNYLFDKLVADAIDIADASGAEGKRFHLVGHDWGGQVSWGVAHKHPERLASLTVLSRPHPLSFRRALQDDPDQKNRSRHHGKFLEPDTADKLLADDAKRLREGLFGQSAESVKQHLGILGSKPALEGALAWYRANKGLSGDFGVTKVPTLYIWGDADATVGPHAAKGTADFVSAAYGLEVLPGVGHFVMDQAAARATELLLAHLKKHPA
ncbi:MAG: alpha/beta hydrolase [Proteobacteria bacterium]|nr:alpha/beta hydrolase [Pseudomonadota bacterium]